MTHALRHATAAALLGALAAAQAQGPAPAPAPSRIYTCTTADGRKLTSDRPIVECLAREQRVLRQDGSTKASLPPSMTPEERALAEQRQRDEAVRAAALADAARYDRNLLQRYPQQSRHDAARQALLAEIAKSTSVSERRIKELTRERKALDEEAEFYKDKPLPGKLRRQVDANEAATQAQRDLIAGQDVERQRMNRRFDIELARLKKLWGGAAPGSLGPAPTAKDFELPGAKKPPASPAPAVKPPASSAAAR